jgi:hypothetical protein
LKKLDLGQTLQLLGNAGVIIGILLLVYELNQNGDLVRAQIHQSRADAYVSLMEDRSNSERLVSALEKISAAGGFDNPAALDQLTDEEAARVRWYLQGRQIDYDNLYYQYQQGYLDEEYYRYHVVPGIGTFAPWWEKFRDGGGRRPSFEAEIDRILASD